MCSLPRRAFKTLASAVSIEARNWGAILAFISNSMPSADPHITSASQPIDPDIEASHLPRVVASVNHCAFSRSGRLLLNDLMKALSRNGLKADFI